MKAQLSKNKEYKRWEKSISTPDGGTKSVTVEEIDNGYIVIMTAYNYSTEPIEHTTKKLYSKENPLKDLEPSNATPIDILNGWFNDSIQLL